MEKIMNAFVHRVTRSVAALVLVGTTGGIVSGSPSVQASGRHGSIPVVRPGTGDFGSLALPAVTTGLVSSRPPDGLILSTGNLYFTSHDAATASVWRAAQTSRPGQEILLYSEPGARFGDIVFAQV